MMTNPTVPVHAPAPALVEGQLWKFDTRCIRIGHVGKHLVEHRGVSVERPNQRAPKRLIAIVELQKFLAANEAVLLAHEAGGA
jgi:hypothetical protein